MSQNAAGVLLPPPFDLVKSRTGYLQYLVQSVDASLTVVAKLIPGKPLAEQVFVCVNRGAQDLCRWATLYILFRHNVNAAGRERTFLTSVALSTLIL